MTMRLGDELQSRNVALDGLRGLAATAVIFFHAILHANNQSLVTTVLPTPVHKLTNFHDIAIKIALSIFQGNTAVLLFFVLSGFVLKMSWDRRQGSVASDAARFVVRRMFRLYPALWFAVVLLYVISTIYAYFGAPFFQPSNLRDAILNLTLLRTNFLHASLTIQVEMMAIPFLLGMFFLDRVFGIIGLFGAIAIAIMSVEATQLVLWLPAMHVFISAFAVGVLIADKRFAAAIGPVPRSAAPVAFVACLAFRAFLNTDATSAFLGEIFLCACLVLSVYHSGHPRSAFMRFLTSRPVQFLGRISYSLYLLNIVVLFVAWSIFDRYPWYNTHMLATGLTVGVIVTLVSLPLADFSERFIERTGIDYGKAVLGKLFPDAKAARTLPSPAPAAE